MNAGSLESTREAVRVARGAAELVQGEKEHFDW